MNADERERQAAMTDAVADAAGLDDGQIVTGWLVVYETASVSSGSTSCGHMYGPEGMTTWRALGLAEWSRRFTLVPDPEEDA